MRRKVDDSERKKLDTLNGRGLRRSGGSGDGDKLPWRTEPNLSSVQLASLG